MQEAALDWKSEQAGFRFHDFPKSHTERRPRLPRVCMRYEKRRTGFRNQIQKIQGNFLLSGNGLGGLAPGSEQKLLSISVREYHATREKNKNPRHRISSAVLTLNFLTVNEKGTTASRDTGLQKKTVEINQPIYIVRMC